MTWAHLAFDFVVIGVDLGLWLLPVDESLRLIRHEARGDGPLLPVFLLLCGIHVMTHRANIKYASKRLYFLDEERPVRFLSNTVVHDFRLEWVWAWLLMFNLHPDGTELIDFGRLAKTLLLYRSLPILASRRDSDPALRLRNNLHHLLWLTIYIRVHDILVFWIV